MDIVVALRGLTYCIDTAIVAPFSSNIGLMTAASGRPGFMAKREEKNKFERYPCINLIPFILETTGRPGYHAQKFIKQLYSDADHPPTDSQTGRLESYPNHSTQQHLQTTASGSHYVTVKISVLHTLSYFSAPNTQPLLTRPSARSQQISALQLLTGAQKGAPLTVPPQRELR